jgi:hypothetical protein
LIVITLSLSKNYAMFQYQLLIEMQKYDNIILLQEQVDRDILLNFKTNRIIYS